MESKVVKIQCRCGQRYSFEIEADQNQFSGPILCPVCGADGTEAANKAIAEMPRTGHGLKVARRADPPKTLPQPMVESNHHQAGTAETGSEVRRGKVILVGVFGVAMLLHVVAFLLTLKLVGKVPAREYVRLAVLALMFLGIYSGISGLKYTFIVLALIGAILRALNFIANPDLPAGVEFAFGLVVAGLPAGVLLFSRSVTAFLEQQIKKAH